PSGSTKSKNVSVPTRSPARGRYGPESIGSRDSQSWSAKPARSSWLARPRTWRTCRPATPICRPKLAARSGRPEAGSPGVPSGERVRAVEAAGRAAHDLDAVELEGKQRPQVVLAARLVDGHAVHEDAREVGFAPAHEERALQAESAVAGDGDAGDLFQQREDGRGLPLRDAIGI